MNQKEETLPNKGKVYNGECNRTACDNRRAKCWNKYTHAWYCIQCCREINEASPDHEYGTEARFGPICYLYIKDPEGKQYLGPWPSTLQEAGK